LLFTLTHRKGLERRLKKLVRLTRRSPMINLFLCHTWKQFVVKLYVCKHLSQAQLPGSILNTFSVTLRFPE
jgi:hypothetical protein